MTTDRLLLGPLLRYVDTTSAAVWVETRDAASVVVRACGRSWAAATFGAHGHHYALVEVDGLEPGSVSDYTVEVDGEHVWPRADSEFPPSRIATLEPGRPLRLAFGSCRTSVPHDEPGNRIHGVDALRAYALHMASGDQGDHTRRWPDLLLFLGDQVYADETTDEMREFIESRRDPAEPPWFELKDYQEYAHLYELAWTDPANRWLLSTLPSAMIFDDHDIRDDWNTSRTWREQMEATSWWHGRIVAGLGSYWVYQHLGNLSPAERAEDELWQKVVAWDGEGECDLTRTLDAFAARVDQRPDTYRWSYGRDIGEVRLVVVDSRAARRLEPGNRSILDDTEMAWLDDQMQGGCRHLLVGTSLPFLLSAGLHHLEALNEALVNGAWGRLGSRIGERMRQAVDLEHWAAFQNGFAEVAEMALAVAYGERGPAPETVTFLSGDVHHSYVSEVHHVAPAPVATPGLDRINRTAHSSTTHAGMRRSRIVQAVCSPIRNPLPRAMRFATAFLAYGLAGPMGMVAARSAHVPDPPFRWRGLAGPWFDNNLAVLEDTPTGLRMSWFTGVVEDDHERPRLDEVTSVLIQPGPPTEISRVSRWTDRLRRHPATRSRRPR